MLLLINLMSRSFNPRPSRISLSAKSDAITEDEGAHFAMSTNDLFIKDAFLVFRALCKLTMKPLNQDRSVVLNDILGIRAQNIYIASEISSRTLCGRNYCLCILC